jgi:hypothetical protein
VTVPSAGNYHLTFRYAAGAGDAARLVYANDTYAINKQTFASTGSWDTWSEQTVSVYLPAGASTVSLIFNSSLGSANYMNLDYLSISP